MTSLFFLIRSPERAGADMQTSFAGLAIEVLVFCQRVFFKTIDTNIFAQSTRQWVTVLKHTSTGVSASSDSCVTVNVSLVADRYHEC